MLWQIKVSSGRFPLSFAAPGVSFVKDVPAEQRKQVMLEQKANYGTVTLKVGGVGILFKAT